MHYLKKIAYVLVIIGALNWGLYGAFGFNLVESLLGSLPMIESIVYVLVGISGLLLIFTCKKRCSCSKDSCTCEVEVTKTPEQEKPQAE